MELVLVLYFIRKQVKYFFFCKSTFKYSFLFFKDFAYQLLLHQLTRIPNEQIEIYTNDDNRLPPKLRLPTTNNKPSSIIIFAKQKFYFTYNTEQNPNYCEKNKNNNCQESSKK